MTAISVRNFSGVSPRTPARYLQDTQAQTAINCPAWLGSLVGIPGLTEVRSTAKTNPKSIFKYGNYWFEWLADTNIVRSPIAGDVEERVIWSDGVKPKKSNNMLALTGGTSYPVAAYDLGVPRPTTALTALTSGSGSGVPETRVYTTTFVTAWGEESQPADPSNGVDVMYGQSVTLSGFATVPAGNHNISKRRIYRSVSGTSSADYLFVAEIPAAQTSYSDAVLAEDLGEVLPSTSWATPPDTLSGLVSMPNGMMAGFSGRDVYYCEPFRPYAWPAEYIQTVDYPIVGLGVMDTTLAVLTTGVPYFLQGSHPDSTAMVKSDMHQACVSKRSIVSMLGSVFYASPDGLVRLTSGGSGVVTEQLFTKAQWQALSPATIHAYQWENKYVAFHGTGGFVFDPLSGSMVFHDIVATAGYNDLETDQLYLVASNKIWTWYTGAAKSYVWKSKMFSLPTMVSFSCAQVEAESYPVTFKFYADSVLKHTQTVTSRGVFRLPAGFQARDIEFEVSGSQEVFSVAFAQSPRELAGV